MKTGLSLVLLASMACLGGGVALGFGLALSLSEERVVPPSLVEPVGRALARHKVERPPKQGVAAVASAASPARAKKAKRPPKGAPPAPPPDLADPAAREGRSP
jgi:hypothetical protein